MWIKSGRAGTEARPNLDQPALHAIDAILEETIKEPVGLEFMAPRPRKQA